MPTACASGSLNRNCDARCGNPSKNPSLSKPTQPTVFSIGRLFRSGRSLRKAAQAAWAACFKCSLASMDSVAWRCLRPSYPESNRGSASAYFFCPCSACPQQGAGVEKCANRQEYPFLGFADIRGRLSRRRHSLHFESVCSRVPIIRWQVESCCWESGDKRRRLLRQASALDQFTLFSQQISQTEKEIPQQRIALPHLFSGDRHCFAAARFGLVQFAFFFQQRAGIRPDNKPATTFLVRLICAQSPKLCESMFRIPPDGLYLGAHSLNSNKRMPGQDDHR